MSAGLLWLRLRDGEAGMPGAAPIYHAVGDEGDASAVALRSKGVGDDRRSGSDVRRGVWGMPYPGSTCPCMGRISPKSGLLDEGGDGWLEGFVFDIEVCAFLGGDERAAAVEG